MTEDWRNIIDYREAVATLAVGVEENVWRQKPRPSAREIEDLSWRFSPQALEIMSTYRLGRQQCVRLEGVCSNFKTVKTGVP